MNRQEFIDELGRALSRELSPDLIQTHLDYYNNYINAEVNSGKLESSVIDQLGNPRLIAKTIIDSKLNTYNNLNKSYYNQENDSYHNAEYTTEETVNEQKNSKGFNAQFDEYGKINLKYGKFKLNSWYGKLITILLICAFFIITFFVIKTFLSILFKFILPLLLIFIVISLIKNKLRQ